MNSNKKNARNAGFWYLMMAITGPLSLMYIPSNLIVNGNPALTAANILNSELLFRFGIISEVLCQLSFIFLAVALYKLFMDVDKNISVLLLSIVIAAVPVAFLNELNNAAALIILKNSYLAKVFEPEKLQSFALFFLNLRADGIVIAGFFWGLWLLPFGMLVKKSGFIPKILGILLIINGFAYLVDSSAGILFPNYRSLLSNILLLPMIAGEIPMLLWLLIKGASDKKSDKKN